MGAGGSEKAEVGACCGEGEVEFVTWVVGACEVNADAAAGVVDGGLAPYGSECAGWSGGGGRGERGEGSKEGGGGLGIDVRGGPGLGGGG